MKLFFWLKSLYRSIVTQYAQPKKIATGAAVGVFIGIFPTFGIGGILALALSWVFKYNRASALLGSAIMNPITSPFFWFISLLAGTFIWGENVDFYLNIYKNQGIFSLIKKGAIVYFTGNVIISVFCSAIMWFLVYLGAKRIQIRRNSSQTKDIEIGSSYNKM